jgi:Ca2+-binding RTX toxin-like protein
MAKVFLTTDEEDYVVANLGDVFYGSMGAESIFINQNVAGIIVDSNTESVSLTKDITEYSFQQNGNVLSIYSADGATLITRMAIGDNGSTLIMNGVSHPVVMDATQTHPMSIAGKTVAVFTLTMGQDNIAGTTGDDTFNATYGDGSTLKTIQPEDIINGANGVDSVNIITGSEVSTPPDGLWTNKINLEEVAFRSTGDGVQTITTGSDFEAAFATGVDLSVETQVGAINLTMDSYTKDATITTATMGAGVHTILTGSGVTTVNATSYAAGAQTINGAGLTTVNALIVGAGVQTIGTTAGQSIVSVNATIEGAGAQQITSTSALDVTIVANATNGVQTIVTSTGDDHVTTTGATGVNNTISTMAGDDIIVAGAGNDMITGGTGRDIMTGGAGRDIFVFATGDTGTTLETADVITDFSSEDIIQAPAGSLILTNGSAIANFADFTAAATISLTAGSAYAAYNAAGSGDAWVVIDSNNDGILDATDAMVVLSGVNLASEMADVVAPMILSAEVSIDGRSIVITHSEALMGTPEASDYGVTLSDGSTTITGATLGTGADAHIVTISLSDTVASTINVTTLIYTANAGSVDSIQDTSATANKATTQTLALVTNNAAVVSTLTTGVDNITGTAGADRFNATYGDGDPDSYTLESADALNGGAGIDTLHVTTAQEASTPNDALWAHTTNFEKIAFNSIGNGAQTVTTGANFQTAFATGVDLSVQTLLGAITVDMTGYTQTTTVNTTTIGAGAQTITTGTGVATVNATTLTDGAQTISGVNLTIVNAEVLGNGAQTITSTSTSNVTVVADAHNGAQTITTGAGNDHVTTTSAAGTINAITTGAGNDVIIASAGSDVITGGFGADIMSGGTGADTFNIGAGDTGLTLASADIITDFTSNDVINATSMVGGATIVDGSVFGNFDAFVAAASAAYTVNSAAYIAYNAAGSGDAWVFMDHDNSDTVNVGDSVVVLEGINTAAKIDLVAPRIVSASVSIDGRSIVITHSESLTGTPEASDYGVTLSSGSVAITGATLGSGVDANKVTIALSDAVAAGLSVTNLVHTSSNALSDGAIVPYSLSTQTLNSVTNSSLVSTYTFTMGTDNLSGTADNDTFNATYGDGSTLKTIQAEDIINGGNGIDTVNIVTGAEASTPGDGLWTNKINLEEVAFRSTGDGVQTITTGSDFEAAFATGVDLSVETQVGAINLTMDSYTKDATITTATMGAGVHTILTGSGVTTVNATSYAAGAQTINGAGLTTVNALIVGAGVQTIGTTAGQSIVSVNATIEGAGAQQITSTSALDVTIVANATNGVQTIVTSTGDDHVTTTGATGVNNTISTMAGDDIIVAGAGNDMITGGTGRDIMTGGAGRDIFVFATGDTGTTLETADVITDFSSEDIIQAPAGSLILTNGSAIANFADFTAAATISLTAGSAYAAYNAAGSGDAWVVIDSNNDGILDATDAMVVLSGVNLASEMADVVAPMILSAEVSIDGRSIVITHSEALMGTPEASDYGVTLSDGSTTITGATLGTGADAHKVTIALSDTIASTLSVTSHP